MLTIYKTMTFDSAHQLKGHEKCGFLHGHTYKVEIWLTGEPTGEFGFLVDFHEIKNYFNQFDHSGKIITDSVEKMAQDALQHFMTNFDNVSSCVVRIWETPTAYAEVKNE